MNFKPTLWDLGVVGFLVFLAWDSGVSIFLLAFIAGLVYFAVRCYVASLKTKGISGALEQPVPPNRDDDDSELLLFRDELGRASVEVDIDIKRSPAKNRFVFDSMYDTGTGKSEHEYRITGTEVFTRVLQDYHEDAAEPREWRVLDGVVQESDMWARWEKKKGQGIWIDKKEDIEENIADWKKRTEWSKLPPGVTAYFILFKNLSRPDGLRFFRQELERFRLAVAFVTQESAKLGYEPDEFGMPRRKVGFPKASPEAFNKLWADARISYDEFASNQDNIAILQDLIAGKTDGGVFEKLISSRAAKAKEVAVEKERIRKADREAKKKNATESAH
jgi:hypothetical protein